MGKKKVKKSAALKLLEKEERMVKNEVSEFYQDGERVDMERSSDQDPFTQIISTVDKGQEQPTAVFTEEQMQEQCFKIRNNVKDCIPDNIEINFVEGVLKYKGNKYELGSTAVKAVAMDASKAVYLHMNKKDVVSSLVFIGGDSAGAQAFLVTKNANKTEFIRLQEFHLLSISENSTSKREIGLMVSYLWISATVYFSIIMGSNLDPIKNLLLTEELISKSNEKSEPLLEKEVDVNEQSKEN